MSNASGISNITYAAAPHNNTNLITNASNVSYTTEVPFTNISNMNTSYAPAPVIQDSSVQDTSPSTTYTEQTAPSMYNISNTTDGSVPDFIPRIHNITVYLSIIIPIATLVLIWFTAACARHYCTPCKPKKPSTENKKTCCKAKKSKPKPKSSCCCRKGSIQPENACPQKVKSQSTCCCRGPEEKTPEERMISQA